MTDPRVEQLVRVERRKAVVADVKPLGLIIAIASTIAVIFGGFPELGLLGTAGIGAFGGIMAWYGHTTFKSLSEESLALNRSLIAPADDLVGRSESILVTPEKPLPHRLTNARQSSSFRAP